MIVHDECLRRSLYDGSESCTCTSGPSGYSDHWCHSGDMDDREGCLSGQAEHKIPMTDKENDRPRLPNLSGHFFDLLGGS